MPSAQREAQQQKKKRKADEDGKKTNSSVSGPKYVPRLPKLIKSTERVKDGKGKFRMMRKQCRCCKSSTKSAFHCELCPNLYFHEGECWQKHLSDTHEVVFID